jgi:predicted RNA-binding Zn-ribbon protein involved in translation (DUF1610 family)
MMVTLTLMLYVLVTVSEISFPFESRKRDRPQGRGIPFKCISCGDIEKYTISELQKMPKINKGPMMGPMKLNCPKCGKDTLTQAVVCPSCGEIFVMKMDPAKGLFDDKCTKCGKSYAKAWQEKYRKAGETAGNRTEEPLKKTDTVFPQPSEPIAVRAERALLYLKAQAGKDDTLKALTGPEIQRHEKNLWIEGFTDDWWELPSKPKGTHKSRGKISVRFLFPKPEDPGWTPFAKEGLFMHRTLWDIDNGTATLEIYSMTGDEKAHERLLILLRDALAGEGMKIHEKP